MCSLNVWETLLLALLMLTGEIFVVDGKTTCYVCSWSGSDRLNGTNVPDTCTPKNFRPESVHQIECYGGCETIAMRGSKNGNLDHFHRNCVQTSSGRVLRDRCLDIKGKVLFEERCECMSDLCNSAPSISWPRKTWKTHYFHVLLTTLSSTILVVFSRVSLNTNSWSPHRFQ